MRSPDHGPESPGAAVGGLLDVLPLGIAELDAAGRVVRVNRTLADLLGFRQQDAAGRRLSDVGWRVAGRDGPDPGDELAGDALAGDELAGDELAADDVLALLLESGRTRGNGRVLRLVGVDGRDLYVRASASRVRLADPRVAVVLTMADVTAETRAGLTASDRCEKYRILADHVEDVVIVYRGEAVTWVSPSVRAVLGVPPTELIGKTVRDFTHPDDVAELPGLTPQTPKINTRLRVRHVDGGWRWFAATVTSHWNDQGGMDATYTCLRQIDDQVLLEREKLNVERRMRLAFEASPDGFAIVEAVRDGSGDVIGLRLQSMNRAGRELLGLDLETDVSGRDVRTVLPDVEGSGLWGRMLAVMEGGGISRTRTEHSRSGRVHTIDGFQARLDEHSLVLSFRDVTELVEGERLLTLAYEETAEMRATLQTALDATSDCFAVYALGFDDSGTLETMRVVHTNAAGAESLGLEPDVMVGMELHEFFPEVEKVGLWEKLTRAALTKAPQYHRVHLFDSDGTWIASWDNTVAPVGEERMTITWRNVSKEESALRQLQRTRDEAMYSATHDALTDLPNRVLLRQHLHEALRVCQPDERVGLVFVDLDKFKAINDTYGHAAGDTVLKATATRLSRLVRHGDLAARLAGDEFVLVLTRLAADWKPDQFFARANTALTEPVMHEDVELRPSASLGVVLADQERLPSDADALIKEADAAMYRNKAARRAAR